jgi:carbamoyltransferase
MYVLGISALYHDAAAALLCDGAIVAAVQEERFTRRKHDPSFPTQSIAWCLAEASVPKDGLTAVVYYDKPLSTFSRILRSYAAAGLGGLRTVPAALSEWLTRKLWTSYEIEKGIRALGYEVPEPLLFSDHHMSHAASAFYPSPFGRAATLTIDGVGEWATSSIGRGSGSRIELLEELRFPHSVGLLYSAFTYQAGFKVNSGEYKLMGLAPFGEPKYERAIREELIDLAEDGSFRLNMEYFDFLTGRKMTSDRFAHLLDGPARQPEGPITQRECDLARSVQVVLEEIVLRMARHAHRLTGESHLVLAGGVALNCVSNARLWRDGPFDDIWIQPAAGDAGSALGAALWGWHQVLDHPRSVTLPDAMQGAQLGPSFDADQIASELVAAGRPFRRFEDRTERDAFVAGLVAEGKVVGLFQGRMEFGPRALGNRSIIADPRSPQMQSTLNLRTKNRESFRPFAPAVLAERASEWFDLDVESPYMLLTAQVSSTKRRAAAKVTTGDPEPASPPPASDEHNIYRRASEVRSEVPAITHVDHSARVQTVDTGRAPAFHALLRAFEDLTECPILINTSFNVRGEPIVATPEDAYRCFMTAGIDWLVLEDCVLARADQPEWVGGATPLELD